MFCGLKQIISCNLKNIADIVETTLNDIIEVRRFGLDQNNVKITYDDFGEPIDFNAQQNYFSFLLPAKVDTQPEVDEGGSNAGGRVSNDLSKMEFNVSLTADLKLNDLIAYPAYSPNTYRIRNLIPYPNRGKMIIYAYSDDKETK